jgi:phage terminase small subunit
MPNAAALTAKQVRWVEHYLATGNASASAVEAGYSANGASVAGARMLRNASVQNALQARQAADATRLSLQREDVLNGLQEVVNQAREQRNPMALVRAWAEIAKMLGLYAVETKRVEVNSTVTGTMERLELMSDAELATMIAAGSSV